jgi:hypothetical protein
MLNPFICFVIASFCLQANFQIDCNPDGQDLERIADISGLSKRVVQVLPPFYITVSPGTSALLYKLVQVLPPFYITVSPDTSALLYNS